MLESFRGDPSTLLGKQFILGEEDGGDEGDSNGLLYEVIEVRLTKGGGKVYHVQFEGCSDCVDVASEEMAGMLKRSTSVDRTSINSLYPRLPPPNPPQPAPVAHPFRGEALRPASLPQSAAQPIPNNPLLTGPSTPQRAPNRDTHALHFDHNYRLLIDGKPF